MTTPVARSSAASVGGVATAIALLLLFSAPALANGAHPGAREVFAGEVGRYAVSVATAPVAGAMHFTMELVPRDGAGGGSVAPRMTLSGAGPANGGAAATAGPVGAYATIDGPLSFAADIRVEPAGAWEFTLTIDDGGERVQAAFPVAVQEPGGANLTLLALIAIALAIFGFTLGNRIFGRRRRRGHPGA